MLFLSVENWISNICTVNSSSYFLKFKNVYFFSDESASISEGYLIDEHSEYIKFVFILCYLFCFYFMTIDLTMYLKSWNSEQNCNSCNNRKFNFKITKIYWILKIIRWVSRSSKGFRLSCFNNLDIFIFKYDIF